MHPYQNPNYARNEEMRDAIRSHNNNPQAYGLTGKLPLPKMVNKYVPHQGKREIARRLRQEARHGA